MGGRLDSTNIITPLVSVITSIGLDHTQFLGNTLASIATEKAGIIKEKIPVVIGSFSNETKIVFDKIAEEKNAPIYYATDVITKTYPSDLKGYYQASNQKTVLQTLKILTTVSKFKIYEKNIKKGLLNVVKNTGLKGRWQQIESNPKTVCDTAHNKQGLEIVMKQIQDEKFDTLHFVLGFVNDKNLDEILPLFPKNARYYFSKPNNLRALETSKLQEKANDFGLNGKVFNSITEAYENARQNAKKSDFIYVGGSTFVVAEIL
jgi:dihydrofolate synthase/folylpolyglutamate synthase